MTGYFKAKEKWIKFQNECESQQRQELLNRLKIQQKTLQEIDIRMHVYQLKEEKYVH